MNSKHNCHEIESVCSTVNDFICKNAWWPVKIFRFWCWSPVDGQIFFFYSAAAGDKAKAAQHQELRQHHLTMLPRFAKATSCPRIGQLLPSVGIGQLQWAGVRGLRVSLAGATRSLPGQTLPMGAGESWALQGKPGERKSCQRPKYEF